MIQGGERGEEMEGEGGREGGRAREGDNGGIEGEQRRREREKEVMIQVGEGERE